LILGTTTRGMALAGSLSCKKITLKQTASFRRRQISTASLLHCGLIEELQITTVSNHPKPFSASTKQRK
jgi:hypothetical protein